jgi:GNAT superfamily N-acetyltransferase
MQELPSIDMVVPLLKLPPAAPHVERLRSEGILVRRAKAWESEDLREFVLRHFTSVWAGEVAIAFSNKPVSAFLAFEGIRIVGFAAYDCTYRNLFGPIGVDPAYRNRDVATALLLSCLDSMKALGYLYAIIGLAGPRLFFKKTCGAVPVPEDWPKYMTEG